LIFYNLIIIIVVEVMSYRGGALQSFIPVSGEIYNMSVCVYDECSGEVHVKNILQNVSIKSGIESADVLVFLFCCPVGFL